MWHYLIASALLGHGLGHVLFLGNTWGYWNETPGRAGFFTTALNLSQTVQGLGGLLWLLPLCGFVAASWGYVEQRSWWTVTALIATLLSVLMIIFWWGSLLRSSAFFAIAFDVVILLILYWQRQANGLKLY